MSQINNLAAENLLTAHIANEINRMINAPNPNTMYPNPNSDIIKPQSNLINPNTNINIHNPKVPLDLGNIDNNRPNFLDQTKLLLNDDNKSTKSKKTTKTNATNKNGNVIKDQREYESKKGELEKINAELVEERRIGSDLKKKLGILVKKEKRYNDAVAQVKKLEEYNENLYQRLQESEEIRKEQELLINSLKLEYKRLSKYFMSPAFRQNEPDYFKEQLLNQEQTFTFKNSVLKTSQSKLSHSSSTKSLKTKKSTKTGKIQRKSSSVSKISKKKK